MTPPTRLAFWAASWMLWACALPWRFGRWLDRNDTERESGPSWTLLWACYAILALYGMAWVVWASTDVGYFYGYRR